MISTKALRSAGGIVTIGLESSDRHAIVIVRDNGMGIETADLEHIFDRFDRVQVDRARNTGGTGLGLAIVQAHNGSIQVDSQLNRGSIFTVTLPLLASLSKK